MVLLALKNYAQFSGRSSRKEFWWFTVICVLFDLMLSQIDQELGLFSKKIEIGVFSLIFWMLILIPSMSIATRRLHDIGKSGWWQLLIFIPFIGLIALISFYCRKSYPFQNAYGPMPNGFEMRDK